MKGVGSLKSALTTAMEMQSLEFAQLGFGCICSSIYSLWHFGTVVYILWCFRCVICFDFKWLNESHKTLNFGLLIVETAIYYGGSESWTKCVLHYAIMQTHVWQAYEGQGVALFEGVALLADGLQYSQPSCLEASLLLLTFGTRCTTFSISSTVPACKVPCFPPW